MEPTIKMERDIKKDLRKLAEAFFKNLVIDDCEFGSIGLDPKRPFGNSFVEVNILEIIEYPPSRCGDEYSESQYDYARELYFERLIPYLKELGFSKMNTCKTCKQWILEGDKKDDLEMSDAEKLLLLADWIDLEQKQGRWLINSEKTVQADLRRMAKRFQQIKDIDEA